MFLSLSSVQRTFVRFYASKIYLSAICFLGIQGCGVSSTSADLVTLPDQSKFEVLCPNLRRESSSHIVCSSDDIIFHVLAVEECKLAPKELRGLTRGLLAGFSKIDVLHEEAVPGGIRTFATAELDLRPVTFLITSGAREDCVYDSVIWTPKHLDSAKQAQFGGRAIKIAEILEIQRSNRFMKKVAS